MRGPKLNEGATYAQHQTGERHGTKATAKHVRSSAYKARVVLDLIRGLPVYRADEVLRFTDRAIAKDIRKVLASAVANATDTENAAFLGDADELFVLACFADEGATMRRFRPRARGRATRIRKRTCHITVVVARMSEGRLEIERNRAEGQQNNAAASRRARVERSRARTQSDDDTTTDTDVDTDVDDATDVDDTVDAADETVDETTDTTDESVDTAADDADGDADTAVQGFADVDADTDTDDADTDDDDADDDAPAASGELTPGEWTGSVVAAGDGKEAPEGYPIKGNADSMLYHVPGSRYYKVTKAEVWFDTEENAEAAGFSQPGAKKDED